MLRKISNLNSWQYVSTFVFLDCKWAQLSIDTEYATLTTELHKIFDIISRKWPQFFAFSLAKYTKNLTNIDFLTPYGAGQWLFSFILYLEILLAFQNGHHLVVIPIRSYFTCLRTLSVSLAKRSPEKNNEILNSGLVSLGKAIIYV